MPDTFKFLLVIGIAVGIVYGTAFLLANNPPSQRDVTQILPNDRLRSK